MTDPGGYRYFVSFAHEEPGGNGFTNTDVVLPAPVTSMRDILAIEAQIAENNDWPMVKVINYQYLGREHPGWTALADPRGNPLP